jgi:membrane protein
VNRVLEVARTAVREIREDRILTYAAALAIYSALSLPPILVILLWALGFTPSGAEEDLKQQAELLIGADGRRLVDSVLASADRQRIRLGGVAGTISTLALFFAATGVFAQLQLALNTIWDVEAKPGRGLWNWVRRRLLSLGLLGSVAFLMLVSLTASTAISAVGLAQGGTALAEIATHAVTIVVFTVLFATVFKFLPDVHIRWRDVWAGAFVTSILFAAGKALIGLYLANKGLGASYGVVGPAIVVLAWVYFSAAIVFVGAELTQSWLLVAGRRLEPNEYAVKIDRDKG